MKQKLTKEEAIKLFRQMWTDMQTELGDCPDTTERLDFKKEWCDKNLPDMYVQNYCPLCEYAEGLHHIGYSICRFCPIDWPGETCYDMNNINYYEAPISEILALPEREVPDNDYTFSREASDKLEKVRGVCRYDIASMYPLPLLCRRGGGRF